MKYPKTCKLTKQLLNTFCVFPSLLLLLHCIWNWNWNSNSNHKRDSYEKESKKKRKVMY